MMIPEAVRLAALFPMTDLPPPPPEHPFKQVIRTGYAITALAGLSYASVTVQAIARDGVERAVADVRDVSSEHGMVRTAWFVPEAARPEGLAASLRAMGMAPYDQPPLEPRYAAMALLEEPQPAPFDIEARLAETFEEYQAALRVDEEAFDMSSEDRAALEAHERQIWALEQSSGFYRTFVALIRGEVVGSAWMVYGANAAFLAGGSSRADMRGRGVYRALVRARWDAAVDRGTPALTVAAGRMSRPILETLGFDTVGWGDCLLDQFA